MRTRVTLLAVVGAVMAAAGAASADSYVSLGLGNAGDISGGIADDYDSMGDDGHSGRLGIGQRLGPIALEASVFGTDLVAPTGQDASLVSVGVDLKYHWSLLGPLELYGKLGLNKGWVREDTFDLGDSGRGWAFGGGLQYRFSPGPLGSVAVWLDYTNQRIELDGPGEEAGADSEIGLLNLGLSVGL